MAGFECRFGLQHPEKQRFGFGIFAHGNQGGSLFARWDRFVLGEKRRGQDQQQGRHSHHYPQDNQ